MKVAIITIIDNINLGTVFQAYALADKITELGHQVEIINYWRPHETAFGQIKERLAQRENPVKRVLMAILSATVVPYIKHRLFSPLYSKFRFSRKYTSIEQLRDFAPQADLFFTGSDQVWNCSYNQGVDECFFLNFTSKRKCAYAASVGTDEFPSKLLPKIKKMLTKYETITVRERTTAEYFRELGFQNTNHVLDPTLLITKDEWLIKFGINEKGSLIKDKYLLVYSVESKINDFIFEQAKKIADQKNLKLVALTAGNPFLLKKYKNVCDKIYSMADTYTFLLILRDASFVVASSFHGTAFSINFNKEFITITPPRFNIRMKCIIEQFNLQNRVVCDKIIDSTDLEPIDYPLLNQKLNNLRQFSIDSLQHMIEN